MATRHIYLSALAATVVATAALVPNELRAPRPRGAAQQQDSTARRPNSSADSLRFVAHQEHVAAGFPSNARPLALRNPYEANGAFNANAVKLGGQLFVSYNCIDCHGADGSGAMGPSLADGRWHFGGGAAEVFESIYQGRPDGMPSWGGRIADDQIWMLVTYVRSLSAGKTVSTENFTGKTVERTGH